MKRLIFSLLTVIFYSNPVMANETVKGMLFGIVEDVVNEAITQEPPPKEKIEWQNKKPVTKEKRDEQKVMEKQKIQPEEPYQEIEEVVNKPPLCLSGVCIGMTMQDVLDRNIKFVDGRKIREENIKARFEKMRGIFGNQAVNESLRKTKGMINPKSNSESYNMRFIKGLNKKGLAYLSTFYPDDIERASLDNKAFQYMSEALTCRYFPISVTFFDKNNFPVSLEFHPLYELNEPVLTLIEKGYAYQGENVKLFVQDVSQTFAGYDIGTASRQNIPDIVLNVQDTAQRLVLLHPERPTSYNTLQAGSIDVGIQNQYNDLLIQQDSCSDLRKN